MPGQVGRVWFARVWRSIPWWRIGGSLVGVAAMVTVAGGQGQRQSRDAGQRTGIVEPGGEGAVAGRVRTRTGRVLGDAVVTLEGHDGSGRVRSAVTDRSGRYGFERVPVGRYRVWAAKGGFGRRYYGADRFGEFPRAIEVVEGRSEDDVDVVLARGAVVTGLVRDDTGSPVPSASVFLLQRVRERGVVSLCLAGADRTDDRGLYRVFDLAPGVYYVRAEAMAATVGGVLDERSRGNIEGLGRDGTGYAPSFYPGVTRLQAARPVAVRESQELSGVDLALLRVALGRVRGIVVAPVGVNPVGTEVRLTPADGAEVPGDARSAWATADGAFRFDRVLPGRYVLGATGRTAAGGAAFARQVIDVDGVGQDGVSAVLTSGAAVSGAVRFDGAVPMWREVVDLEVVASALEPGSGSDEARTVIDGDGTFSLRDLPPGPHGFAVRGLGEARSLDRITLNGRDITDRAVTLGGGVRVTGLEIVVTDRVSELRGMVRAGRDTAGRGAVVAVFSTDPERWFPTSRYVRTERPAQDGRFHFRGVPPGDYWVTAAPLSAVGADDWLAPRSLDRLRTGATRVSVRKGDTVDVDVQVRGR